MSVKIQRTQLLLLATMLGDYDYDSTNTTVTLATMLGDYDYDSTNTIVTLATMFGDRDPSLPRNMFFRA